MTQPTLSLFFFIGLSIWAVFLFYSRRVLKPSKEWVDLKIDFDRLELEFNAMLGPIRELVKGETAKMVRVKMAEIEAMLEQLNASIALAVHSSLATQGVAAKLENRIEEGALAFGRSQEAMDSLNENFKKMATELKLEGKAGAKGISLWAEKMSAANEKVQDGIGFSKTSFQVFESIKKDVYGISRTLKPLIPSTDEQASTAHSVREEMHTIIQLLEEKRTKAQKIIVDAEGLVEKMSLFKGKVLKVCTVIPSRKGGFF